MMNANVTDLQTQLERVCAERDRLAKALKPFAQLDFAYTHFNVLGADGKRRNFVVAEVNGSPSVPIADGWFKEARAALGDS